MAGDLFELRMVVVSASEPVRELWRDAAALASCPIEFRDADPTQAGAILTKGNIDVVVLDSALAEFDRDAALKAAGAIKPAPFIAVATPGGAGRFDGATVFIKPANTDEACALVERCIRARKRKRVLVVDDSKTMRGIVRKILSGSRYTLDVAEAEAGIAALKSIDGGIDLVLLDYNMPGFNGLETLAEIKRMAPHVTVVMITSTEDATVAAKAQELGAAFLKKPFYPSDIDAVLDRVDAAGPVR
jgi:CheY-like chemotaxis protein